MMTLAFPVVPKRNLQQGVALPHMQGYIATVAANSATGRENPKSSRRTSAPSPLRGVFLRLQQCSMAAVCGRASALPVSLIPGILTPHTVATLSREKDGSDSLNQGVTPVHNAQNPSVSLSKAAAHRAMAMAALHADSSLSVRLKRYNTQMTIARTLETADASDNCAKAHHNQRNAVNQGA